MNWCQLENFEEREIVVRIGREQRVEATKVTGKCKRKMILLLEKSDLSSQAPNICVLLTLFFGA
jgi:hypothetical protein